MSESYEELKAEQQLVIDKRDKRLLSNESGSFSNPSKSAHLTETETKLITFIENLLK